jgi:cytochrome c553
MPVPILRPTLLLAVALHAAPGLAQPERGMPDTLERRVAACASCHGSPSAPAPATGPRYYPRIAGKPAGYLYNQLQNFRSGRRQYPLMTYLVEHLSDDYLREIATYFSTQHLPAPVLARASLPADQLERGRALVTRGDPALKVPACMACHGQRLTGALPAIPGLLGLPRDYINAQFGAWRNGTRRAHAPDCMATVAGRLSLADVAAVSGWLASAPVPDDASPAPDVVRPMPLACGSEP